MHRPGSQDDIFNVSECAAQRAPRATTVTNTAELRRIAGTSANSRACLRDVHASLPNAVPRTLALTGRRLPTHRQAFSVAMITSTVVATAEQRRRREHWSRSRHHRVHPGRRHRGGRRRAVRPGAPRPVGPGLDLSIVSDNARVYHPLSPKSGGTAVAAPIGEAPPVARRRAQPAQRPAGHEHRWAQAQAVGVVEAARGFVLWARGRGCASMRVREHAGVRACRRATASMQERKHEGA